MQVCREPQVVRLALLHPGGQGVPFLLQPGAACGVERDAGLSGFLEPVAVLGEDLGVDAVVAGSAGLTCGFLEGEEGIDGLPGPGVVQVGAGLGDRVSSRST